MTKMLTIAVLLVGLAKVAFAQITEDSATNAIFAAEQELGVTNGKPVTNGFVFVDGKYLPPPYVVTRRGHTVQINGVVVERPCPWPIPETPTVTTEDPQVPPSLTANSSKYETDFVKYLRAKQSYYYEHLQLTGTNFCEAMAKAYAGLPNVERASPDIDPFYVNVVWRNGGKGRIRVVPFSRRSHEWTRASLLETLETRRINYETRLEQGDYFCVGAKMSRTTGTTDGALMTLPTLVEILKTSKDAKEVHQRFQSAGWMNWGEKASEAFFINRSGLADLELRLEALKKSAKEKQAKDNSFEK